MYIHIGQYSRGAPMKIRFRIIVLIIAAIMLLSSCSSVYITPDESSAVDKNTSDTEEYFTQGTVYTQGNSADYYWNGYWLYFENQETIAQVGSKSDGTPLYGDSTIERLVKYNPATGLVSSVCLDPACNHSYESGCLMIAPKRLSMNDHYVSMKINGIVGDWLMLLSQEGHDEYVTTNKTTVYNMKTGEARVLSGEELGGDVMVRWAGRGSFDGKLYRIKHILDYSNTDYQPGKKGKNVLDYSPETTCILYEYDFDTNSEKELFEVPNDFGMAAISNKRFFFQAATGEIYSCSRDGSNMRKEDVLDFAPDNFFGSLAFNYNDDGGFTVYDLTTNQQKIVTPDFEVYSLPTLMSNGMIFSYCPTVKKANENISERTEALRQEYPHLSYSEINKLWSEIYQGILFGGSAQIWKTDFYGEDMRLICEIEKSVIDPVFAIDQYLLARMKYWDEKAGKGIGGNSGNRCVINLETGEFTELPLLDLIVPAEYIVE